MDFLIDNLNFNSVENVPGIETRAAFTINSSSFFKEDVDIVPTIIDDTLSYVPWGADNQLQVNLQVNMCNYILFCAMFGFFRRTSRLKRGKRPIIGSFVP